MVPCITGTLIKFFFASSIPFVIASCTSFAFPKPCPTTPFSFPTTTNAEKLNERPPFVVFTTRLMATTLSFSSRSPALTLFTLNFDILLFWNVEVRNFEVSYSIFIANYFNIQVNTITQLELQSSFACSICYRFYTSMVEIPTTIKGYIFNRSEEHTSELQSQS